MPNITTNHAITYKNNRVISYLSHWFYTLDFKELSVNQSTDSIRFIKTQYALIIFKMVYDFCINYLCYFCIYRETHVNIMWQKVFSAEKLPYFPE